MRSSTSNKILTLLFKLLKCLLGPWCILLHLLTRSPMGKQSTKSSIRPAITTCPFWKLDNQYILALCIWASKVCIFIHLLEINTGKWIGDSSIFFSIQPKLDSECLLISVFYLNLTEFARLFWTSKRNNFRFWSGKFIQI